MHDAWGAVSRKYRWWRLVLTRVFLAWAGGDSFVLSVGAWWHVTYLIQCWAWFIRRLVLTGLDFISAGLGEDFFFLDAGLLEGGPGWVGREVRKCGWADTRMEMIDGDDGYCSVFAYFAQMEGYGWICIHGYTYIQQLPGSHVCVER